MGSKVSTHRPAEESDPYTVSTRVRRRRKPIVRPTIRPPVSTEEKSYDPNDWTLTFVDREDEMDFEYNDYKSPRALMSCGHSVTPMSLTRWTRWQLDKGERKFVCGVTNCNVEWPFQEVRRMALLTPEETDEFEKKVFNNVKDSFDVKSCPGCKSLVERTDQSNLRVDCGVCTLDKCRSYSFCWQCMQEWKGPFPQSDHCGRNDCGNTPLETLNNCPEIVFQNMNWVKGCPSIRACPTCGFLVEHDRTGCKGIVCTRCKMNFCFVCLKNYKECTKSSRYYDPCSRAVAPRQTSIPVWKKKK